MECPWRILQQARTTLSSDDHGQQYGLPAPINAAAEATKLLSAVDIDAAQLRAGTNDILIDFSDDVRLEIIPISSGYEGWQMMIRSVQSSSPGVAGKSHLGRRKLMPNNVL